MPVFGDDLDALLEETPKVLDCPGRIHQYGQDPERAVGDGNGVFAVSFIRSKHQSEDQVERKNTQVPTQIIHEGNPKICPPIVPYPVLGYGGIVRVHTDIPHHHDERGDDREQENIQPLNR